MSQEKIDITELSLEQGFEEIEKLMDEMSDTNITLEESFEKYKLGMELLKHCNDKIDRVEKEIKILTAEDLAD